MKTHLYSSNSLPPNACSLPTNPTSTKSAKPFKAFNPRNNHQIPAKTKFQPIQPPWHITPPPYSSQPHHAQILNHQLNRSATPISLRLLQLKKKNDNALTTIAPNLFSNVITTLLYMLEQLHKAALSHAHKEEEYSVSILRDARRSMLWLFQRVFASSPDLALELTVMTAEYMVRSVDEVVRSLASAALDRHMGFSSGDLCRDVHKTMMEYENQICKGENNSMVLSNYAQFLYLFNKDYDRAEEHFKMAVKSEPVDPEAVTRYAFFLWHVRGDLYEAEELFVKAIMLGYPNNPYYLSNYVLFLHHQVAYDICYYPPINNEIL